MGLSKDLFFDQVIIRMHQYEARFRDTIAKSCESLADMAAFENSFGPGKEALFISLTNLQQSYLLATDQLLSETRQGKLRNPGFSKEAVDVRSVGGKNPYRRTQEFTTGFCERSNPCW